MLPLIFEQIQNHHQLDMNRFDFDTEIISSPPYDCFMGNWDGVCRTFSPEGEFLEDTSVTIQVNWVSSDQWHFYEHISK
jgi:hypothetical protein